MSDPKLELTVKFTREQWVDLQDDVEQYAPAWWTNRDGHGWRQAVKDAFEEATQ